MKKKKKFESESFTPAPWEIREGGNFVVIGRDGFNKAADRDKYSGRNQGAICQMTLEFGDTPEIVMPNARLIACAPELLQSVVALLKVLDKTVIKPGDRKIIWTAIEIAQQASGRP